MNASEEKDRSSRVEREILEILERSEARQTPVHSIQTAMRKQRASARARETVASAFAQTPRWLSPAVARMGAALLLAIASAAIASVSSFLAVLFAIISAVIFFSLWFPSRTSGPQNSPRWRGQDLRGPEPPFGRGGNRPKIPRR